MSRWLLFYSEVLFVKWNRDLKLIFSLIPLVFQVFLSVKFTKSKENSWTIFKRNSTLLPKCMLSVCIQINVSPLTVQIWCLLASNTFVLAYLCKYNMNPLIIFLFVWQMLFGLHTKGRKIFVQNGFINYFNNQNLLGKVWACHLHTTFHKPYKN